MHQPPSIHVKLEIFTPLQNPSCNQVHSLNNIVAVIIRVPVIAGAGIRVGVLLVHVRGIVQAGGVAVYITVIVAPGIVHLLAMMAARVGVAVVVDMLVIRASGWIVRGAVGAVCAGVGGSAIRAGVISVAIGIGSVGTIVGTVVGGAVEVASHGDDVL